MDKFLEEFKKFAIHDRNIKQHNITEYEEGIKSMTSTVIEESKTNFREVNVFSILIKERIIFLGSEINSEISNVIVAQLLFLESVDKKAPISLYINSPGGEIYSGLSIYDTMQFVSPEIITVCTGLAASMGAILLAGGQKGKRFSLKHSRIMIHQPSGGTRGQASDMEIALKQIKEMQKELYEILAHDTGKTIEQIEIDSNRDNWMNPKEAKEYGLIDNIFERNTEKSTN